MPPKSGREREAKKIRQANHAAAVGRLMLGELKSWQEFLRADIDDLENLPRRRLKSGVSDIKRRLSPEIRRFCSRNFRGMTERKLSMLYEDIKAFRGLEMPLPEFEEKFASVRPEVLKGNPKHLTITFSLWGLQFKFPEDELSKDLLQSLELLFEASSELQIHRKRTHSQIESDRQILRVLVRKREFSARSTVINCFNLMEAYLNGLAWEFIHTADLSKISNKRRKLLEDTYRVSLRDKLLKYPNIIADHELWQDSDSEFNAFVKVLKPFRDALVHPSPFSVPEKFGGYDKLQLFYRVDDKTAFDTAQLLMNLLKRIQKHIEPEKQPPDWIEKLEESYQELTVNRE